MSSRLLLTYPSRRRRRLVHAAIYGIASSFDSLTKQEDEILFGYEVRDAESPRDIGSLCL